MTDHVVGTADERTVVLKRLEGLAWGLFFVWIGVVLLNDLGWGIGLLGFGLIILGGQLMRRRVAGNFETFWLLVGTFIAMGGIWVMLGIRVGLIPVFAILVGVAMLVSVFISNPRKG